MVKTEERTEFSSLPGSPDKLPAGVFAVAIFLSAFLLFQIQPLIAKQILPWFGGSASVWTTCLMFFQVALLGGYAWAHWLAKMPGARQRAIHLGLLVLSLVSLPVLASQWWKPEPSQDPLPRILGLLAATIGLPYLALSSTSPLLQSWYSRANGEGPPWRLFALSNAGSMLGLLTYPVLVEPYISNRIQAWVWSIGYCGFAALCAAVAWRSREAPAPAAATKRAFHILLMALPACASALLLAITSHLTQNVAAIPFLQVLPLSLYLLSFILCFDSGYWYRRGLFACLAAVALPAVAWAISDVDTIRDLKTEVALLCLAAFVLFMVCHGELARRRPAPERLTSFYLTVAAGGALGGLLVGVVAPYALNGLYDAPVIVSLTGFLFVYLAWRERKTQSHPDPRLSRPIIAGLLIAYCMLLTDRSGPSAFAALGAAALGVLWVSRESFALRSAMIHAMAVGLAAGIAGYLTHETLRSVGQARMLARNFYGALVVLDTPSERGMGPERVLRHGTIEHGEQFLDPRYKRYPTAYYAANSGAGLAIQALMAQGPVHVGLIGLGAGTLAAYARPVDRYSIYEINPNVIRIAQTQFTYLSDSPAPSAIIPGDARLSLERETDRAFDLLAVDAFSGDAIPVHLLTREAFRLYWRHLKPSGVLAVHVTNRYLSLGPVVAMGATEKGKRAMMVSSPAARTKGELASDWVLVTSRPGFFDLPGIEASTRPIETIPGLRMWTDDFSNLYRVFR